MQKSRHFKLLNANPYKRLIPDCAIRAVTLGLAMKYSAVCKMFGKRFKPGLGLVGNEGIDLNEIKKKFDKYFDVVEDARDVSYENRPKEFDDMKFDPSIDQDEDFGYTLEEFCDLFGGQGRFLVALTTEHKHRYLTGETAGHIVFCDLRDRDGHFYDTWDSGWMRVQAYMRVDKIWPMSSEDSLLHRKWLEKHGKKQ